MLALVSLSARKYLECTMHLITIKLFYCEKHMQYILSLALQSNYDKIFPG